MATHSCILAWEIPWTEEPNRLQSMGLQESDTIVTKQQPQAEEVLVRGRALKWNSGGLDSSSRLAVSSNSSEALSNLLISVSQFLSRGGSRIGSSFRYILAQTFDDNLALRARECVCPSKWRVDGSWTLQRPGYDRSMIVLMCSSLWLLWSLQEDGVGDVDRECLNSSSLGTSPVRLISGLVFAAPNVYGLCQVVSSLVKWVNRAAFE